jgi:hypothetical protein
MNWLPRLGDRDILWKYRADLNAACCMLDGKTYEPYFEIQRAQVREQELQAYLGSA